jgi:hypothetical protein
MYAYGVFMYVIGGGWLRQVAPGDAPERKSNAVAALIQDFGGDGFARSERIERVLHSLSDDAALKIAHVTPVRKRA